MNKLLFRNAILLQLESALPASLPLQTLHQGMRLAGHDCPPRILERELDYLVGKHCVCVESSALAHGYTRYRLTAMGRDYLESQGLA